MKRFLILLALSGVFTACTKYKYDTTPTVTIDSFGPSEVIKGQDIVLTATVTDDEGDLQDSVKIVRKIYKQTIFDVDTIKTTLADLGFPTKRKIQLQITFRYGENPPGYLVQNLQDVDRPMSLGLIVKDKAGNRSQYVESDKILLKKL